MAKIPALVGTGGHVEGESFPLDFGKTLVVGRSRSADFSLRRITRVASMSDDERENDQDLRTVSGKHFEITLYNVESIEIVNLSPNGTYVDGKLVDKIILTDVAEKPHEITIGAKEQFRLELKESSGEAAPPAPDAPPAEAEAAPAEGGEKAEAGPTDGESSEPPKDG
jgi:hypothetical protein